MKRNSLISLMALLMALLMLLSSCAAKEEPAPPTEAERYAQALELFETGSLTKAREAFATLGGYEDAQRMTAYLDARSAQESGEWAKAQEAFARYVNWVEPIILAGDAICVYDGRRIVLEKAEEESLEMMRANVKAHKLTALSSAVNVFSGILGFQPPQ